MDIRSGSGFPFSRCFWQRLAAGDFHDRVNARFDAAGKISFAKARDNHFVDDSTCDRVRQNAFEAVADFDAELAVVLRDYEDGAVVELFLADLPALRDADAEAFDIFALQAWQREHGDLMAGLGFELPQPLLQRLRAARCHEVRVVVHASAQRRDVEGASDTEVNKGEE